LQCVAATQSVAWYDIAQRAVARGLNAVCCSAMQCVAVRCSVLQGVAVRYTRRLCRTTLQCVVVCCSAQQCVGIRVVISQYMILIWYYINIISILYQYHINTISILYQYQINVISHDINIISLTTHIHTCATVNGVSRLYSLISNVSPQRWHSVRSNSTAET